MVINLNNLRLEELRKEVKSCNACELCKTRTNTVFGMGTINTDLLFVGEAPGRTEDEQGLPFVGRSGQLFLGSYCSRHNSCLETKIYL